MLELKPTTGNMASLFRLLSSLLPSLFMYSVPFSVCFPSRDLLRVCLSSEAFLACVHSRVLPACKVRYLHVSSCSL